MIMNTLPLFFKLTNQPILIIGGGEVAMRKAEMVMRSGAIVSILAPHISSKLKEMMHLANQTHDNQHQLITANYQHQYLSGYRLIIACTNDKKLNEQIYHDAKTYHIPVNVVDNPDYCDFIFPAIVDRSPIMIGISSNGKAPVLTRLLRAKIETMIPKHTSTLAKIAGAFRRQVKQTLPSLTQRRQFWENVFEGEVSHLAYQGKIEQAKQTLITQLDNAKKNIGNLPDSSSKKGEVYIVGAGAGDPELLTFKALRLMQQADVVLYDTLVSPEVLDLCRRDAHKIYVGKKRSQHTLSQEAIQQKLIEYAKQGYRVVRLKGGDPLIFARGGEEMLALKQHDIPYQVVPGITSATAAASYAGIPLTYRNIATSVRFITACLKNGELNENIKQLLNPKETIVIYMGLKTLDILVKKLIDAGRDKNTPIAIISNASLDNQQVITGTLSTICDQQQQSQLPTPALIIIGEVVSLYQTLNWITDKKSCYQNYAHF